MLKLTMFSALEGIYCSWEMGHFPLITSVISHYNAHLLQNPLTLSCSDILNVP